MDLPSSLKLIRIKLKKKIKIALMMKNLNFLKELKTRSSVRDRSTIRRSRVDLTCKQKQIQRLSLVVMIVTKLIKPRTKDGQLML